MEYKTLVRELGEKLGFELDGSIDAVGLEIEDVAVVLQLAGGPRGDILFTHADLGLPPSERRDALGRAVLEANFLYQGTGGASFALNPADGHLHLQRYDWLARLDAEFLGRNGLGGDDAVARLDVASHGRRNCAQVH